MIRIIELGEVPTYTVSCPECLSILEYIASDVKNCEIICPVCNSTIWIDENIH